MLSNESANLEDGQITTVLGNPPGVRSGYILQFGAAHRPALQEPGFVLTL